MPHYVLTNRECVRFFLLAWQLLPLVPWHWPVGAQFASPSTSKAKKCVMLSVLSVNLVRTWLLVSSYQLCVPHKLCKDNKLWLIRAKVTMSPTRVSAGLYDSVITYNLTPRWSLRIQIKIDFYNSGAVFQTRPQDRVIKQDSPKALISGLVVHFSKQIVFKNSTN